MAYSDDNTIEKVRELFFKRGFSRITMDELASEMGISKKTLYNHYSGKKEILELVIKDLRNTLTLGVDQIMLQEDKTFKEKLLAILSFIGKTMAN